MGVFSPRNTPNLLNWIKVWWVGRHFDKCNAIADIFIFRPFFRFNQTNCLFMPGSVVHNKSIFLSLWCRMSFQESSYWSNRCFIVESLRLTSKQFTAFWDDETAVWNLESSRKRLDFRFAPPFEPSCSHSSLDLKVDFVLIYKDQGFVLFDFGSFFLNVSLSSVFS